MFPDSGRGHRAGGWLAPQGTTGMSCAKNKQQSSFPTQIQEAFSKNPKSKVRMEISIWSAQLELPS